MMEEVKKTGLTFTDTRQLADMSYRDIKNGFVGFGYYLKIIHDEKLWQGNGYNSFNQFLDAEYGKDKSWASRCINLYDKFGVPVEPGELPRLEEQYEAYNVSQLIEMLPIEEEQRERVTPDMPVKAIRDMKPKKEKKVATVATPEPTPPEPEQDSCPPGITDCRRQEWGTEPEEQEVGKKECKACWASWKRQHKALGAAAVEQEPAEEQKDDRMVRCEVLTYMCDSLCGMYAYMLEKNRYSMASIEKISGSDFSFGFGDDGHGHSRYSADCKECRYYVEEFEGPGKWVFKAGEIEQHIYNFNARKWHEGHPKQESEQPETEDIMQESGTMVPESNPPEDVIDGEFTEIPEPDASDQEAPMNELQIAQSELERAKRLLEKGLGCGVDENDIHIRRLKTTVCAWASYVCDLDSIVNPPPKPVQPELPPLKNNDQRAAFVDAYETWPLWIETAQTGERYYRYDLEDGTSMVVKVYHAKLFYSIEPGGHDFQYREGYGRHEYYLLQPGMFFRDCDTNRSLLIEKLKEIQKPKKG